MLDPLLLYGEQCINLKRVKLASCNLLVGLYFNKSDRIAASLYVPVFIPQILQLMRELWTVSELLYSYILPFLRFALLDLAPHLQSCQRRTFVTSVRVKLPIGKLAYPCDLPLVKFARLAMKRSA